MAEIGFLKNSIISSMSKSFLFAWILVLIYLFSSEIVGITSAHLRGDMTRLMFPRLFFLIAIVITALALLYHRFVRKTYNNRMLLLLCGLIFFYETAIVIISILIFKIYLKSDVTNLLIVYGEIAFLMLAWVVDLFGTYLNEKNRAI